MTEFATKYKEPETSSDVFNRALAVKMRLGLMPRVNLVRREYSLKHLPAPSSYPACRRIDGRDYVIVSSEAFVDLKNTTSIKLSHVVDAVLKVTGMRRNEVLSKRRFVALTRTRHLIMFLARRHTSYSFPYIGKNLGGFDHSSILHGCRKIEARQDELKDLISACESELFKIAWASVE